MKFLMSSASAFALVSGAAVAGGVDRSGQSTDVLFEEGRHLELSFAWSDPEVSGVERDLAPPPGFPDVVNGDASGDMAPAYSFVSAAYKADLNDRLSYAVIIDHPFGADVDYPGGTGYYAGGATAELRTTALTVLAKRTTDQHISVFGGLRVQSMQAEVFVPYVFGYVAEGERDWRTGWVVGAAWEKPEIAARVSLTYSSAIDHELDTVETATYPDILGGAQEVSSTTPITTPRSINLSFQTGIAEDTLLFGNIRWVEWTKFVIAPELYYEATGIIARDPTKGVEIVSFDDDRITYMLGIGRRLNETWSIAVSADYEETLGGISSNLSPTDGRTSVGIGATYTKDNVKISAGIRYIWVGEAKTQLGEAFSPAADWQDNTAVAAGIKVSYKL